MTPPELTVADVRAAARRITPALRGTPVMALEAGALGASGQLWLKLEQLQHTGSFKVRGALNRLLAAHEHGALPRHGVVAASGGNAGLAVAYAARALAVPAEVYLPTTAPPVKVRRLRDLGAHVVQHGAQFAQADAAARERAQVTGALYCHAYDQVEVCAGQGTIGLELLEQIPGLDTIVLAVGGGGLLAGVATAVQGRVRVVGVEPGTIPTLHQALAADGPVDVGVSGVAADALGARRLGDLGYAAAIRYGVRSLVVDEPAVLAARDLLWRDHRLVVEHGCAVAVAALTGGGYQPAPGETVAVLLCGANTGPGDLS